MILIVLSVAGCYSDYLIQEGMDSVSMSHLTYPPMMPVSPLPNPRDQTAARLSSQNLSMAAESARHQSSIPVVHIKPVKLSIYHIYYHITNPGLD